MGLTARFKYQFILACVSAISSGSGFATGGADSGGGTVVICGKESPEAPSFTPRLLDYYEAPRRGVQPTQFDSDLDYSAILKVFINRIEQNSPIRARKFRKWSSEFAVEAEFTSSFNLGNISDTGPIPIGDDCKLLQAAAQLMDLLPGDPRYYISEPLFKKMSEVDKAGLILHELIYREMLEEGQPIRTTRKLRYFNLLVAGNKLVDYQTDEEKWNLAIQSGLTYTQTSRGVPLLVRDYGSKEPKFARFRDEEVNWAITYKAQFIFDLGKKPFWSEIRDSQERHFFDGIPNGTHSGILILPDQKIEIESDDFSIHGKTGTDKATFKFENTYGFRGEYSRWGFFADDLQLELTSPNGQVCTAEQRLDFKVYTRDGKFEIEDCE